MSEAGSALVSDLFAGGGEMGERMRALDWSRTPVGPPAAWPRSLQTAVRILLTSRFAMWLGWGPELTFFCNDAYQPTLGLKQSWALGASARRVWAEIWNDVGPRAQAVLRGGVATWDEGLQLVLERRGFPEETYHTFSYSPLPDDGGGVGGLLCVVTDETLRTIDERRLRALRALSDATASPRSAEAVCHAAVCALGQDRLDLPFLLLYLEEEGGAGTARLVDCAGLRPGSPAAPPSVGPDDRAPGTWPLPQARAACAGVVVEDVAARFGPITCAPWPDPVTRAMVLPLSGAGPGDPAGFFVAGVSPRRPFDPAYRGFLGLLAGQISGAIADARTYEAERQRAERLAELDQAKTAFLSNVSHEFHTPLTLILGPVEDALATSSQALGGEALRAVHRNCMRLTKLVNNLLDLSRIESGRAQAHYAPTDLAEVTAELAEAFRPAVEQARLRFEVHCPPLPQPIYVDRDMWEKVVLNLLSNALKFTFDGLIQVQLQWREGRAELCVRDTGTGIASDEVPRLFQRFHRVQGVRSRTHEGAGIGLALVAELVRLHGGQVRVESEPGRGSCFRVTMPGGSAHLPQHRLGEGLADRAGDRVGAAPFVQEALRWLPEGQVVDGPGADGRGGGDGQGGAPVFRLQAGPRGPGAPPAPSALSASMSVTALPPSRILLADDNPDMREYVGRLLRDRWEVEVVADGAAALEAVRVRAPDIILADVVMPGLDGFELLREVRSDPQLAHVPVIMLANRSGEETLVEGLEAGADDYLVKPFSARELMARVSTHLQIARLRVTAERARAAAEQASRAKDEFLAMLGHELRNPLAPILTALQVMHLRAGGAAEKERAMIERQVRHLARLVDDLLDVSRITRGKVQLDRQPVEVAEVVNKAIEMASPLLEHRQHHLQLELPSQALEVDADLTRLAQVVANLLTNSAKYTDPGGRIVLSAERRGGEAHIRVRDNGIGIAPEVLPHVFDTFVQGRQSMDRSQGGLGLGLAIVRSLVSLHGGQVAAHSDGQGQGSEFTIRLPALASTASRGAGRALAAAGSGGGSDERAPGRDGARGPGAGRDGLRILVVDDNPDAADLLAELLRELGHEPEVANDAPSALRLVEDFTPDLAFLDIGLPVMDGYELARRLREQPRLARTLIVALTGYGQEADRRRSAEAGFHLHLVKPVDLGRIQAVVHAVSRGEKLASMPLTH